MEKKNIKKEGDEFDLLSPYFDPEIALAYPGML